MKLGFDIDEVVNRLMKALCKFLNEEYKIEKSVVDIKNESLLLNRYADDEALNKKIAEHAIEKVNDPDFQAAAEVDEDAIDAIRRYKKAGHSIHFISSRPVTNEKSTIKWLRENKVPFDSVDLLSFYGEKGILGRALNLDCFVDDMQKHLESMWRHKKHFRKGLMLLTRPWNANNIDGSRFIRVNNWKEISRHLGIQNR